MCTRLQAPQEPRPAPPWRTNFARSITRQADRARLWLRNLGRDDRVVSDWGCEARYPFLDEGVVATVAALPLPLLCDLRQVAGRGDKQVLRRLARRVGLTRCASLQKRAIQFGTRIAQRSAPAAFGSVRRASGEARFTLPPSDEPITGGDATEAPAGSAKICAQ
jgi:asparagine synthetase B (glutamine-hydrolysing)